MARSHRLAVALGFIAFAASAQTKPRVAVLDLSPLDPEVSRAVSSQLTTSLQAELGQSFSLVSQEDLDRLRSGVEEPPDVSQAMSILAQAKERLSMGQPREAVKLVKQARQILDPLRPKLRDYTPLTLALLYSGVAALNLRDKRGLALAFSDLARLRPAFQINAAEFPPNVLEAFEKARQREVKAARGRLQIVSTPPGAKAFVDEQPVGVTPITVPQSPGEHLVRVEQPGYLNWTKAVQVESYAKTEVQAPLERNAATDALAKLETSPVRGTGPDSFDAPARTVAAALKADGVVVGIVGLGVNGYVASVAYLPAGDGPSQVAVMELDRSLKDAKEAMQKIAASLTKAAQAKLAAGAPRRQAEVLGRGASRKIDFGKFALGMGPGGSAQVMADAEAQREALNLKATTGPVQKPTRWWLWAGGGVVVAAAAAGTAAFFLTQKGPSVQFELDRQP